jgi:hypothetical protein
MKVCAVDYPFDEFARHFEAMEIVHQYEFVNRRGEEVFIGNDRGFEVNALRIFDYMQQQYENDIALEKGSAFVQIVSYLTKHLQDFDTGKLAVRGEGNEGLSLVSESLLRAVHHACMHMTEEEWRGNGPAPEKVKKLAEITFANYK